MDRKPPPPFCKVFLICHEISRDPDTGNLVLVGHPSSWQNPIFPATMPAAFLFRLSCCHGDYTIEVQLRNAKGKVVCRAALPESLSMPFPLEVHELTLDFTPTFPAPGDYCFVLMANGEEVECQPFNVRLTPASVPS
jgi:hypothetical protein